MHAAVYLLFVLPLLIVDWALGRQLALESFKVNWGLLLGFHWLLVYFRYGGGITYVTRKRMSIAWKTLRDAAFYRPTKAS